jgi:glycosyltransferase involved in cell wall biosynthesis
MRISVVSSSVAPERLGGSEAYAADLAAGLAERHEVMLHTGATQGPPGVVIERLPGLPDLPGDAAAVRKATWHLRDQWRPQVHGALKRQLQRFRPDVVHTNHPQGLSAAVFSAISSCGLPHVHTAHDANVLCARITMTRAGRFCGGRCLSCRPQRLTRVALLRRSLGRLIAPSDYFRDMHVRAGVVLAARAETIRQGAQPGTARMRGDQARGRLVVGYLGALAQHKGVRTLVSAFRRAPAEWQLRLAGSGPLEPDLKREAQRDERVQMAGLVFGEQRDAFLNGLDVLVIPSEYEENAPLVAVEAAVRGLPAVVSDRGGLPETAEAEVFRAGDVPGLIEALLPLAEDPGLLAAKSRRLLDSRERFSWGSHVLRLEATLRGIVP